MTRFVVKRLADHVVGRLREGDASLLLRFLAPDVRFRFPGQHPFAADHTTREDVAQWWMRFAHFRPQFEIHDVLVAGPPWDLRVGLYFTDQIGDPRDGTPYVNEGMCLFRFRWCKVVEERVFLDTQAVAEFFGTESPEEFFGENFAVQP